MAELGNTVEMVAEQALPIVLEGRAWHSVLSSATDIFVRNAFGYWMSALQDGIARVQWISFTADLAMAPVGHVYTEVQIEARWLL